MPCVRATNRELTHLPAQSGSAGLQGNYIAGPTNTLWVKTMASSPPAGHNTKASANAAHAPFQTCSVSNWSELAPGETVLLVGAATDRYTGVVDDVAADGSVMWLVLEDGDGRKLFHQDDGFQTIVEPDRW